MVASPGWKPFASFLYASLSPHAIEILTPLVRSNGWISILGWWLGAASVANFIASMILEIVLVWHTEFVVQRYHQYLLYVAVTWLAVAINVFASRWIPLFNKMIFFLAVSVLSATMLTLFIIGRNDHAPADWIFGDATNSTGWPSDGFAFMLAISNAVYSFLGSDCAAHLCEEIPNPAKNVPRVILYPLLVGMLTAYPFAVSLLYAITDLDAVFNSPTGLPLIEIYYQGTRSKAAASVLLALFAFCFFGNMVANGKGSHQTAVLRMMLSFVRHYMLAHALGSVPRQYPSLLPHLDASQRHLRDATQRHLVEWHSNHGEPYQCSFAPTMLTRCSSSTVSSSSAHQQHSPPWFRRP